MSEFLQNNGAIEHAGSPGGGPKEPSSNGEINVRQEIRERQEVLTKLVSIGAVKIAINAFGGDIPDNPEAIIDDASSNRLPAEAAIAKVSMEQRADTVEYEEWKNQVNTFVTTIQNEKTKDPNFMEVLTSLGLNETPESIDTFYKNYLDNKSDINKFVTKVLETCKKEGTLDEAKVADLLTNTHFKTLLGVFGKEESVALIMHDLEARTLLHTQEGKNAMISIGKPADIPPSAFDKHIDTLWENHDREREMVALMQKYTQNQPLAADTDTSNADDDAKSAKLEEPVEVIPMPETPQDTTSTQKSDKESEEDGEELSSTIVEDNSSEPEKQETTIENPVNIPTTEGMKKLRKEVSKDMEEEAKRWVDILKTQGQGEIMGKLPDGIKYNQVKFSDVKGFDYRPQTLIDTKITRNILQSLFEQNHEYFIEQLRELDLKNMNKNNFYLLHRTIDGEEFARFRYVMFQLKNQDQYSRGLGDHLYFDFVIPKNEATNFMDIIKTKPEVMDLMFTQLYDGKFTPPLERIEAETLTIV